MAKNVVTRASVAQAARGIRMGFPQIRSTAMAAANGNNETMSALSFHADDRFPRNRAASARVAPHPGQSRPVASKMGQRG